MEPRTATQHTEFTFFWPLRVNHILLRVIAVQILAPLHISSELAYHASHMYSKNVGALVVHLTKEGKLNLDLNDDITSAVCITANGEIRNAAIQQRLEGTPT